MGIHRGTLVVDGTRDEGLTVKRPAEAAAKLDAAIARSQACDALVTLGWKAAIARAAVDDAMSHVGLNAALEDLIREALRRCPKPVTR